MNLFQCHDVLVEIYSKVSGTSISTDCMGCEPIRNQRLFRSLSLHNNKLTTRAMTGTRCFLAVEKFHFCVDAIKLQFNANVAAIVRVCQSMEFFGDKSRVSWIAMKPILLCVTKLAVPSANPNPFVHDGSHSCKVSCVGYIGVEGNASMGEANIKRKEEKCNSGELHICNLLS